MHSSTLLENKLYFSKYKPDKKIGEGSFGKIYSAHNISTNEKYALKFEYKNSSQSLLEQEAYILCYLKGKGIPFVKSYGYSGEYNILVMELLGKSLEDLFQERGCNFSIKTVCMLAIQMIERLEYIHKKHIIHRDIKPDNFTMGLEDKKNLLYLIDFGLSKKYRSSRTLHHIKYCENKRLTGTARYASIHALKGCEQGRRDDMEALGYVMLYFLRGSLPWQGLKVRKNEDKYKKICDKKKNTLPSELCAGFPQEFCEYIVYTRNLKFEEEPNYNYLRSLFIKYIEENNIENDMVFDWDMKKSNKRVNDKENRKEREMKEEIEDYNFSVEKENRVGEINNNDCDNMNYKNKENNDEERKEKKEETEEKDDDICKIY